MQRARKKRLWIKDFPGMRLAEMERLAPPLSGRTEGAVPPSFEALPGFERCLRPKP
ncbi:hypothetical protein MESS2_1300039 [Mesorhizobium metallidurans STM 2683]|uniref:Uncharacterized protein n=1 Tax=Mesorhizobium metallidurans STM 2683 TaxID=1297569 RepID=M5EIM3_9HYPH|nr:hypothetical protein MESS2_1300039 [Mesorhizobium metallidurans STM 2683]